MQFSGYWVKVNATELNPSEIVQIERATFDETDLNPATDWKEAWQNQDPSSKCWGYVSLDAAMERVRQCLSR